MGRGTAGSFKFQNKDFSGRVLELFLACTCPGLRERSAEFGLWTFLLVPEGILAFWTSLQLTEGMGFRTDGTLDKLLLFYM